MHEQASTSEADAASSQFGQDDAAFNDEDRSTSHSRSTSAPLNGETVTHSAAINGSQKMNGKGKGKDRENSDKGAQVRVKEEPVTTQLSDIPAGSVSFDIVGWPTQYVPILSDSVDEPGPLFVLQLRWRSSVL